MHLPYFFAATSSEAELLGRYLVVAPAQRSDRASVERAQQAAARVTADGLTVRHLAAFVADDTTVYHLYEGPSAAAVQRAATLAELSVERVVSPLA